MTELIAAPGDDTGLDLRVAFEVDDDGLRQLARARRREALLRPRTFVALTAVWVFAVWFVAAFGYDDTGLATRWRLVGGLVFGTATYVVALAVALLVALPLSLRLFEKLVFGEFLGGRHQVALFGAEEMALRGADASYRFRYEWIDRLRVRPGFVVLRTRTGLLRVLPRELVPDEAMRRIEAGRAAR